MFTGGFEEFESRQYQQKRALRRGLREAGRRRRCEKRCCLPRAKYRWLEAAPWSPTTGCAAQKKYGEGEAGQQKGGRRKQGIATFPGEFSGTKGSPEKKR